MTAALYERMWAHDEYRAAAPGEGWAHKFVQQCKPYGRVIDFGCGTGRGAELIHAFTGLPVLGLDFAANCLDADVRGVEFRQHDLRERVDGEVAPFGYCTDVMEHIAPDDMEAVLTNILLAARRVFFAISTVPDNFGPLFAGEPLHLTVKPHAWWRDTIERLGARVDWDEDVGNASLFYVSIYANGDDYCEKTGLNVSEARVIENIKANLALGLPEICPHAPQDTHICVLAGGPSLADHEAEIIERGRAGQLFVTVNGTYRWLLDRGIKPSAQFMVDAREFNSRFIEPIVPTCRYIMSSQAAHEAIATLPRQQTLLFHSGESEIVRQCFEEHCMATGRDQEWYPVIGGSTVICRALVALAMLGFRNIEIIGWDSCMRRDEHHAYPQAENDGQPLVDIEFGGRWFQCQPWMVVQAHEVPRLIKHVFSKIDGFNLNVRGDGLIAHMLEHAASLAKGV